MLKNSGLLNFRWSLVIKLQQFVPQVRAVKRNVLIPNSLGILTRSVLNMGFINGAKGGRTPGF